MLRWLRVLSLAALVPALLFVVLITIIHLASIRNDSLDAVVILLMMLAFAFAVTPLSIASEDVIRRQRRNRWFVWAFWAVGLVLALHGLESLPHLAVDATSAIGWSLLLVIPPLISYGYGMYVTRTFGVDAPAQ